ncbi:MAG: NAD(P)-binding domain-containing protein [Pseudomonadota bacterium]|nr:NAD(P)-binding domain-containing protein [Pseudomonadota bacterium]
MLKVGVVGAGAVGSACALSLILRGSAREIVIVDRTRKRAEAVATDMRYGAPLSPEVEVRNGDYPDLQGASLVMITAGANEKSGGATDRNDPQGRLKLLDKNVEIYKSIVPEVVKALPDAVLLVVTDPPDPLADLTRRIAGHDRILSTGTYLDSLRFRVHLAKRFGVSAASVEAQILGEHGTSEVFVWSSARVASEPVADLIRQRGEAEASFREGVEKEVRYANITIIEGNDASQYGIGMVCARLAEAILRDENLVIPVGAYNPEYGVTLSVPGVLGAQGVSRILAPSLSGEERRKMQQSADKLKDAVARTAK